VSPHHSMLLDAWIRKPVLTPAILGVGKPFSNQCPASLWFKRCYPVCCTFQSLVHCVSNMSPARCGGPRYRNDISTFGIFRTRSASRAAALLTDSVECRHSTTPQACYMGFDFLCAFSTCWVRCRLIRRAHSYPKGLWVFSFSITPASCVWHGFFVRTEVQSQIPLMRALV